MEAGIGSPIVEARTLIHAWALPCPLCGSGPQGDLCDLQPPFLPVRPGCPCPSMALGSQLVVPAPHRGPLALPAQEWHLLLLFKEMGKETCQQTNRKAWHSRGSHAGGVSERAPGLPARCSCCSRVTAGVDHCAEQDHGCEQLCLNTETSYVCQCSEGFLINEDLKTCSRESGSLRGEVCKGSEKCEDWQGVWGGSTFPLPFAQGIRALWGPPTRGH